MPSDGLRWQVVEARAGDMGSAALSEKEGSHRATPGELRDSVPSRGNLRARPGEVAEHSPAQWNQWRREEDGEGRGLHSSSRRIRILFWVDWDSIDVSEQGNDEVRCKF